MSNDKRKFIWPDYIDGTTMGGHLSLAEMSIGIPLFLRDSIIYANRLVTKRTPDPKTIEEKTKNDLIDQSAKDITLFNLLSAYVRYAEGGFKNYILSKPLSQELKEISLNVTTKILPREFAAFIEPQDLYDDDKKQIQGVFVHLTDEEKEGLYIKIVTLHTPQNPIIRVTTVCVKEEETFEEALTRLFKEIGYIRSTDITKHNEKSPWLKFIINAILYITSDGADFIFEKNDIPKSSGKRKYFESHFTPKNWILVGKDFHTKHQPRGHLDCGVFTVSGHFRWQVCGPQRSSHKLIWIDSFEKGKTKPSLSTIQ